MAETSRRGRLASFKDDLLAGLVNGIVSVPDGLACGALVGVNPIYGLYTSITAPFVGSLLASSQLMQVATTSASALAAGQAIAAYPAGDRDQALFLLVAMTGAVLVIFGLLRLGRLLRFVSHGVMTGFLIGVAVVLIIDQLSPLVGYAPTGETEATQMVDLFAHVRQFDALTLIAGLLAMGLAIGLRRTRIGNASTLVALLVPTLLVRIAAWESVERVTDVSPIPRGIPSFTLPDLTMITPQLVVSALGLAAVIAIQAAGVSQTISNPDGSRVNASRDMFAQGAANIAAGLFSGIPAGGSVGQTALNVSAGARSRLSGVLHGIWVLIMLLLAPAVVGQVPMSVLAAIVIVAAADAIDVREARSIWNVGGAARWPILITFLATLFLPIPIAITAGVILAIGFTIATAARDISVRMIVPLTDGRFAEKDVPAQLPSNTVTTLNVYGDLFFAGARRFLELLPSPAGSTRPVVVLRLRGRTRVGSTLVEVLDEYADSLEAVGGRLYLTGISEGVAKQMRNAGKLDLNDTVHVVVATDVIGDSTREAIESANAWLARRT